MSNNTFNYFKSQERYHLFSKLPINDEMGLGNVVNKSGHTIIASDVWAEDIPWFVPCANQKVAITTYSSAKKADLITMRGKVYQRNSESISDTDFSGFGVNSSEVTNEFARLWELYNGTGVLNDNDIITNINDKPVLKYHKGAKIDLLTVDNNSIGSKNTAGRIWKDGEVVKQFVSINDKIVNGVVSNGYKPAIYSNGSSLGAEVATDEATEGFYINSFGGVIFFLKDYSNTTLTANIFEYVGQTLETKIAELEESGGGSSVSEEQVKEWAEEVVNEKTLSGSIAEETTDNLVTDTQVKDYVTTKIGEIPATDLSDYYTKEEVDDALESKVDESTVDSKISTAIEDALGKDGSIRAELDTKADTSALENLASKDEVTTAINSALGEDGAISGAIDDVKTELSDKIETAVTNLAEGAVKDNTDAIATLNGDVNTTGSVAKTVADAIAGIDVGVTSVTVENTNDNVQVAATTADGAVTLKVTTSDIASQSDLTALQTTVGDENSGLVKAVVDNAAAIANKASQSDLNALEGEIAKKAAQVDVDALTDRVTTAEGKIDAIKGFSIVKVKELPTASADYVGKIYLKSKTSSERPDVYEEYICVETEVEGDYSWELIGSTEISLDGYVTDDELTSHTGDEDIHVTDEQKTSWTTGAKTAESNAKEIDTIKNAIFDNDGNSKVVVYEAGTNVEFADGENGTKIINVTVSSDEPIVSGVQSVDVSSESHKALTVSDTTANPKIKLIVDGEVASGNEGIVTGGTVYTAIENSKVTISAKNADNYYGSSLLTVENDETVTIVANPAKDWSYEDLTDTQKSQFANVSSVENGMMFGTNGEYIATIDAKHLTSGVDTFSTSTTIVSFAADMPNLTNGSNMFSGCENLVSFCADLSSLETATNMFSDCKKLDSFAADLSSLSSADGMFANCALSMESVEFICYALPSYELDESGTSSHVITIDCGNESITSIQQLVEKTAKEKGWTITYNGVTYPLTESTETE